MQLNLINEATKTFRHGIHPGDYKELTSHMPIERMPFMDEIVLPLSQHLGSPSRPTIKAGDKVYRGQLIGE
ncbi:electron transport complex subunit RsxC, partial [candidate division KSB1 bacterium]|nr:electron transport complex subunit RsxC [candidate division KSB1 bacterium]NIS26935.1 electron transport complex subunit RsxC [candidate division KSB1 bacterium]NIT73773.1 electron transport complex subunit RsxC [candidate division KSB1 bacterium]NIU25667.1 electron transport complex subunit RsxC [candidate division KSB1 bacterium]NIU94461.1 electron transport complex subunit RsxC [candidate division KSB1 bacterium]